MLPLLLLFFLCILFLASIGKSLGVRRFYVNLLLRIFEYGRVNIEKSKNRTISRDPRPTTNIGNYTPETEEEDDDVVDEKTESKIPNGGNGYIPNMLEQNGNTVITRDAKLLPPDDAIKPHKDDNKEKSDGDAEKFEFHLSNVLEYIKVGMESIIEDEVTSRFEAEELKNWNLLTRTNRRYEFISWRLTFLWVIGFFIRYCMLMPLRVFICFIGVCWLTFCTALVGFVKESYLKRTLVQAVSMHCFKLLSSALSSDINYHNTENRPVNGICVANHTSPIDVLVLMCDGCYSLIGQRHGGFLGVLQRALIRASPHIWFERAEAKDRHAVAKRLKEHVSNPNNPPILIFPEGTCINNTSVMQFKKGSFEVGGVIYPVAIKYDPRFGDAFWNSSRYSMMQYLYLMMTSWAIVCDVWYLPPMYRREDESAIDFANRVKSVIAKQGGLVDLQWDGQLKRSKPKKEWKERQQEEFTKRLKGE